MSRRHLALAAAALLAACARQPEPEPAPSPSTAVQPVTPTIVNTPPTIDRSQPPRLGSVRPLTVPAVQERTLPNGLRILVAEHRELPVVDARLVVRGGGAANPRSLPGVSGLVSQMLMEGTTSRTALQIADQEAYLGVDVGSFSGWDESVVSVHAPKAVLDSALALFADIALHPAFAAKELDRVRKDRLTALLQQRDQAPTIASLAANSILFGESHPYGRPLQGTEASVQRLSRADLRSFYDRYFRPNNATLIVVGDIDADEVVRRAEQLFGAWTRGTVPPVNVAKATAPTANRVYLIDKPGAPQTSVRIATVGVERATTDYFPLLVMNTVLGDAFTSRLNNTLREKRGFTYGAGSGFAMRRAAGPFIAQAEVTAAKTDSALMEFMSELKGIREPVPAAELEKAKQYIQLQLPGDFETSRDITARLQAIATYDLPLDYYNSYAQRIAAVTQADVQRVAQQYVTPDKLAIVLVGDRKTIEEGVRAANLGQLELRDISGKPVKASR